MEPLSADELAASSLLGMAPATAGLYVNAFAKKHPSCLHIVLADDIAVPVSARMDEGNESMDTNARLHKVLADDMAVPVSGRTDEGNESMDTHARHDQQQALLDQQQALLDATNQKLDRHVRHMHECLHRAQVNVLAGSWSGSACVPQLCRHRCGNTRGDECHRGQCLYEITLNHKSEYARQKQVRSPLDLGQ